MLYYLPFLGVPVGLLLVLWMFSVDANSAHLLDVTRRMRHNNGIIQLRQLPRGIYRLHTSLGKKVIITLVFLFVACAYFEALLQFTM